VERYVDRTGEKTEEGDDDTTPMPEVDAFNRPANALQIWTDADLAKLAKLMKKYPTGTNERWEKIADILERLPWEVTKMAKKVKDSAYQVRISQSD
jgi:DnaJ family protein C protein 1